MFLTVQYTALLTAVLECLRAMLYKSYCYVVIKVMLFSLTYHCTSVRVEYVSVSYAFATHRLVDRTNLK
jgi:hypothetical protein